ncbi:MAG TPA: hypothetical protein PKH77_00795 [Anaerolineae bacterium]|nr:hypothetical protein [Anaerolineae bacterium]
MSEAFAENAIIQLLRAQLAHDQEQLATATYRQKRAEELLGKYLTTLFSVTWGQATAARADVLRYAEEMLGTLSTARSPAPDTAAAMTVLRQCLEIFGITSAPDAAPSAVIALAQQHLPTITQQWSTRANREAAGTAPESAPTITPDVADASAVLRAYLTALNVPFSGAASLAHLAELARQQLPRLNQQVAAAPPPVALPTPPSPAVVTPPPVVTPVNNPLVSLSDPTLPDAAIEAWRIIGREPAWEKAEPAFVQATGHSPAMFRDMVEVLMQQHLLGLYKAPVTPRHAGFCNPRLLQIGAAGAAQYRARFGCDPVPLKEFLGKYHVTEASALTWWLIRATRNVILNGQLLPENPFTIEVFDLAEGIPDGYQREYGECRNPDKAGDEKCSVPDLFVELQARGGPMTRLCIECERGRYANQALKQKLRWTMHNYGQAGFAGVYYVAPAAPEARLLQRALGKLAADLRQTPTLVEKGMLAIFTFDALVDHWLPSPAMVDRWESGVPAEEIPATAARAMCRLKHRQRGGNAQPLPVGEN